MADEEGSGARTDTGSGKTVEARTDALDGDNVYRTCAGVIAAVDGRTAMQSLVDMTSLNWACIHRETQSHLQLVTRRRTTTTIVSGIAEFCTSTYPRFDMMAIWEKLSWVECYDGVASLADRIECGRIFRFAAIP